MAKTPWLAEFALLTFFTLMMWGSGVIFLVFGLRFAQVSPENDPAKIWAFGGRPRRWRGVHGTHQTMIN